MFFSIDDSLLSSPQSCLSKGIKDPESPKKHVTFHDYLNGKENLRQRTSSYSGLTLNAYTGLYSSRENVLSGDFHSDNMRERLFLPKHRTGIGNCELDPRFTSNNLLFFR